MSRKPRSFAPLAQLSLLTLALVSCAGQQVAPPTAPQAEAATADSAAQIVTVNVRADTTEADLLSRYPGATVLALHPGEGYAQILSTAQVLAAPALGGLSLRAQALSVAATEPDIKVRSAETALAQGNTAWSQGNTAWAQGNTAWAQGFTGGPISPLAANAAIWRKLEMNGVGKDKKQGANYGKGVVIAVLDTGVDINHPAFAGRLNAGWDYVSNDATPQDENWAGGGKGKVFGHGTAVTGIVLQVAPNATILPYRVLNPDGEGSLSNIIMAVNNAVNNGAQIINLSLGIDTPSAALSSAVSNAVNNGVMVVASSGNSGDENVSYPARYSSIIEDNMGGGLVSVGSVNTSDRKSGFSTYGANIDVMAPGEGVATTFPGGQRTSATGTSFAAPLVSGAVALAMSGGRTKVAELYSSVKNSATAPTDPNYSGRLGDGTLNVGRLMVTKK